MQDARHTIASYYVRNQTFPDGKTVPNIIWNGNQLQDPDEFQRQFVNEMPYTHFDTQSLDCHILNPEYPGSEKSTGKQDLSKSMSIVVSINGSVRLEERHNGPLRGFSETLVLVPNTEKAAGKSSTAHKKNWLIQQQTLRFVV